jgi:hypothetical protein
MIVFTRHALDRMRQRGVSEEDVRAAFANPIAHRGGTALGTFELEGQLSRGRLCVVYAQPERARRVVVTAYWV